jgi:hypothetical protein
VTGTAGSQGQPQGDLSKPVEPRLNGAVRDLLNIINGGVHLPPARGRSMRLVYRQ